MRLSLRTLGVWLVLLGFLLCLYIFTTSTPGREVAWSAFFEQARKGNLQRVEVSGHRYRGTMHNGRQLYAKGPRSTTSAALHPAFVRPGLKLVFKPQGKSLSAMLWAVAPWVVMLLFLVVWARARGGRATPWSPRPFAAKDLSYTPPTTRFADVAGIDEVKAELEEVVAFLEDPKRFTRLGGRLPKGILLSGPPGTGKTLLARAVAGEAGVSFLSLSGTEFVEMFVGVGARRVRELFEQARKVAPCVVFIDEIDAVGRRRGAGHGGGNEEREQTLNQLLVELDGAACSEGILLLAATNRPDILDPALLRPGRLDRRLEVPLPSLRGRMEILQVHARPLPLDDDIQWHALGRGTPGFSGAELAHLTNEAALTAAREAASTVAMRHFESAREKILMGPLRPCLSLSHEERYRTAIHEAGHALVGWTRPQLPPIHKITILPRGKALGVTMSLPEERASYSRQWAQEQLAFALGGRAAERLVFGELSAGASDDIQRATRLARKMVCEWGMSDQIGPLCSAHQPGEQALFRPHSERLASQIDHEIQELLHSAERQARLDLEARYPQLLQLADALLEREVLDQPQIEAVLQGQCLPPLELPQPAQDDAEGDEEPPSLWSPAPALQPS